MVKATIRLYADREVTKNNIRNLIKRSLDSDPENLENIEYKLDEKYSNLPNRKAMIDAFQYGLAEEIASFVRPVEESLSYDQMARAFNCGKCDEYDIIVEFDDDRFIREFILSKPLMRLVKNIINDKFDYDYHKNCYYGNPITVGPLFSSYGKIGYDIGYENYGIQVDTELNTVEVFDFEGNEVLKERLKGV